MEKQNKAAIAKTVIGTKETLICIRVRDGKMLVNSLFFHEEIQKSPDINKSTVNKKELDLATNLINQMTEPFKPEKFKDEFNIKIKKAIKKKIEGKEIVSPNEHKEPTKIVDIMEALQKSLKQGKSKQKTSNKSTTKSKTKAKSKDKKSLTTAKKTSSQKINKKQ